MKLTVKHYLKTWDPDDETLDLIPDDITFLDLVTVMAQGRNIYSYLNLHDSPVINHILEKIAELLHVEYDDVYFMWILNHEPC